MLRWLKYKTVTAASLSLLALQEWFSWLRNAGYVDRALANVAYRLVIFCFNFTSDKYDIPTSLRIEATSHEADFLPLRRPTTSGIARGRFDPGNTSFFFFLEKRGKGRRRFILFWGFSNIFHVEGGEG